MSIEEIQALDMSAILIHSVEIAEMINQSAETAAYLDWKQKLEQDAEVQKLLKVMQRKKEKFAECERFGHFHPDYHEALEEVRQVEKQLDQFENVRMFKEKEEQLDELLYQVSEQIARAVSDEIKVPSNRMKPHIGCGSGGKCSGNCG